VYQFVADVQLLFLAAEVPNPALKPQKLVSYSTSRFEDFSSLLIKSFVHNALIILL